ncbi:MAG: cell division protein FtsA [Clostridiales bacterium]|nr:cell division protein FtsA [Clostridiales bacterium]
MLDNKKYPEHMVFGLDIGTRSLVGSVGYMEKNKFNVIAHYVKEHDTRAMLDGQIHDIQKVGESIDFVKRELENQIGRPLKEVCIAAAGRVLKTVTVSVETERTDESAITSEDIYSLDLLGIEKAYDIIREQYPDIEFYCVGYSVVKYYMNGYVINNLEGHKAKKISADVLATFLPQEVVEGLYSAVSIADLKVANLTLEPIATINIAIPEQFRLLNIALVDVGAGTSDICITKDGSIVAYGMIPHAGDEITEVILHKCLVDFKTAEKIKLSSMKNKGCSFKDIMGLSHKLTPADIKEMYKDTVETMTQEIADKIIELNGGKSVNAVFIVGGGGKAFGFTSSLAKFLSLPEERVALRGAEVLRDVNFIVEGVKKDPLLVTPIGICINFYNQKNNFIFVNINDTRIKLYDNDRLTVVDAAMQIGFPNEDLFPKRGKELTYTLNEKVRMVRGSVGEAAVITINGKEANINSKISKNDRISIIPSTVGNPAILKIMQLTEFKESIFFEVNGVNIECPRVANVNGEFVVSSYEIKEGDVISILDYYTVNQIMQFMDIDSTGKDIYVNGHLSTFDEPVYANFKVEIKDTDYLKKDDDFDMLVGGNYDDDKDDEFNDNVLDGSVVETESDNGGKKKTAKKATLVNEVSNITISVTINQTVVNLSGKASYTFVDILDVYPFDTKVVGGDILIVRINGEDAGFASSIKHGDILELFWQ